MNKVECVAILTILGCFYGKGKSSAKQMAKAWYMVLEEFDYWETKQAVIEFAKNDCREYGTFPTPGVITREIREYRREIKKKHREIVEELKVTDDYGLLSDGAKRVVPLSGFREWKKTSRGWINDDGKCFMDSDKKTKIEKVFLENLRTIEREKLEKNAPKFLPEGVKK